MIERFLRGLTITSAALLLFRRVSAKPAAAAADSAPDIDAGPPPSNPFDDLVKQLAPVAPIVFANWMHNRDHERTFQARIEAREWRELAVRSAESGLKDQAEVAERHARELELRFGFAEADSASADEPEAAEQH